MLDRESSEYADLVNACVADMLHAETTTEVVEAIIDRAERAVRSDLRRSFQTLGGYVRKNDEYIPLGVALMLVGGDDG